VIRVAGLQHALGFEPLRLDLEDIAFERRRRPLIDPRANQLELPCPWVTEI